MLRKNFGKILFFIFNTFLLIGGVLFVKSRESKKVIENTNTSGSEDIQNSYAAPSSDLPVAEEKTADNIANNANTMNTATEIKTNTAPVSAAATAPTANSSTSNPKPKTKTS
jgi:hypothetical protein